MDEAQALELCEMVANGRTLTSACLDKGFTFQSFYSLRLKNGVVAEAYAHAQESRDELTEDEILDIADSEGDPAKTRNRLDARYKVLAARRPQRWGAKLDLQVTSKPDARAAEQRADARLLRYQQPHLLGQVIDVVPRLVATLTDKQSAGAIDNGPDDVEPDIFAAS